MEVSVLPGRERRRRWSAAEKQQIVEESEGQGICVADVARRHGLHPNQLHAWRRQAQGGCPSGRPSDPRFVAVAVSAAAGAAASGTGELVEIILRNGRLLRLRLDVAQMARLADALEGPGQ
jgi:transposase